uniref:Putative secreted protein n=1 Tax=Anopheles darlingi TaxID=43151 RepID=A0A2M4DIN0_ANODA
MCEAIYEPRVVLLLLLRTPSLPLRLFVYSSSSSGVSFHKTTGKKIERNIREGNSAPAISQSTIKNVRPT